MSNFQIGDYAVESMLGEGAVAVVYRARRAAGRTDDVVDAQPTAVALKILRPAALKQPQVLASFQFEGRVLSRLKHPGILRVYETGDDDDQFYTVMELIDGRDLDNYLRDRTRLPEAEAVDIAGQLAAALEYLHNQGYVHRDIKPSNILLNRTGRVVLADFGTVITISDGAPYELGVYGTPSYLAPEQIRMDAKIDGRADLYALGTMLYLMVAGRKPFYGTREQILEAHLHEPPPPPSEFSRISPHLEQIILRAVAKEPADRFQSGEEFRAALAAADLHTEAPARSLRQRLFGWLSTSGQ